MSQFNSMSNRNLAHPARDLLILFSFQSDRKRTDEASVQAQLSAAASEVYRMQALQRLLLNK